jgi:putative glutamine amidotransferase
VTKRPVVLLPPDLRTDETRRGPLATLVVQRPYSDAILEAGGLPLVPPALDDEKGDDDAHMLDQLIDMADALVLPGGAFDIPPSMYGEETLPACGALKPERTALERSLLVRAERRGLPVLGVCGGMQLMNVVRGGSLYQDLATQRPQSLGPDGKDVHQQAGPKHEAAHQIAISEATQLARIVGTTSLAALGVNSTHHQAVKTLGRDLVATGVATDGLVEAFEDPSLPFYVGVQWHPESMREAPHRAIYRGLIEAARARIRTAG